MVYRVPYESPSAFLHPIANSTFVVYHKGVPSRREHHRSGKQPRRHQCDRKCRGLFAGGGGDYCHPKGRGVFRGEYRRTHCRGRFGAYLHSLLPGGQIPEPEQRRQRPGAVYHQKPSWITTKSSTTWLIRKVA